MVPLPISHSGRFPLTIDESLCVLFIARIPFPDSRMRAPLSLSSLVLMMIRQIALSFPIVSQCVIFVSGRIEIRGQLSRREYSENLDECKRAQRVKDSCTRILFDDANVIVSASIRLTCAKKKREAQAILVQLKWTIQ